MIDFPFLSIKTAKKAQGFQFSWITTGNEDAISGQHVQNVLQLTFLDRG
jgi:hypothetical protein